MSKSKKFLVCVAVLCLLLYPVTAFACSGDKGTGTSLENKIIVPVSFNQGSTGSPQRVVVRSDGMRRITVRYYYPTVSVPGTPSQPQPPSPVQPPSPQPPDTSVLTAEEQQLWELVNAERTSRGLKALEVHQGLVKLARMKSQDMITHNYFAHQSPTYGSPFDMMRREGITYRFAGENLAGSSTVERAHNALMNSPGHRANILNANFTHVGIGIINGGPYGKMFTQMFIGI